MNLPLAIVNGPNLNPLGKREPKVYGSKTWETIWQELQPWAQKKELQLSYFQSNSEGTLIDYLQERSSQVRGILLNPGALAHTSIALRDCVAMLPVPVVEVHLSCIHRREPFRRHSYLAEVAQACLVGFKEEGYFLGLELLKYLLK